MSSVQRALPTRYRPLSIHVCSHCSVARKSTFCGVRGVAWATPVPPPLLYWFMATFCLHQNVPVGCQVLVLYVLHSCWSRMVVVLTLVCCERLCDCRLASHHHRVLTATATRVSSISRARVPPAPPSQPGIYTLGCMTQTPLVCTRTLAASVQAAEEHCPRVRPCGQLLWGESRR